MIWAIALTIFSISALSTILLLALFSGGSDGHEEGEE